MRTDLKTAKVAIIHDWMNGMRGGEHILEALVELFPQCEIFTLFYQPGSLSPIIEARPIHVSFLNRFAKRPGSYRYLLPFFPLAIERFNLTEFDLVVSSSHCVAKGVIPGPGALHVTYCHTPMRYAWDRYSDYFGKSWLEPLLYPFLHYLRLWDVSSSARVDHFIANSTWVAKRIEKYYRRSSVTIHPYARTEAFHPAVGDRGDYYLIVSAFAPYKRLDLAIEACNRLKKKLYIVGGGQDEKSLRAIAGPTVSFLGKLPLEELAALYAGSQALLFPGEEDFGITPLESMASGTPVIALRRGGALDTVVDGVTGVFFDEPSVESLIDAMGRAEKITFKTSDLQKQARGFTRAAFQEKILKFISLSWSSKSDSTKLQETRDTIPV